MMTKHDSQSGRWLSLSRVAKFAKHFTHGMSRGVRRLLSLQSSILSRCKIETRAAFVRAQSSHTGISPSYWMANFWKHLSQGVSVGGRFIGLAVLFLLLSASSVRGENLTNSANHDIILSLKESSTLWLDKRNTSIGGVERSVIVTNAARTNLTLTIQSTPNPSLLSSVVTIQTNRAAHLKVRSYGNGWRIISQPDFRLPQ